MDWKQVLMMYGPDILLLLVNVVLYILFFVFVKLINKVRDKCIMKLTEKEDKISQRDNVVIEEMNKLRQENAELKAQMEKISNAILHMSEVENGQDETGE